MTFGEAVRLTEVLAADPSSQVSAAVSGWSHPFSWVAMLLADTFDLHMAKASRRRGDAWPRPWSTGRTENMGSGTRLSPSELDRILAMHRGG